jgi:hypothetical protein
MSYTVCGKMPQVLTRIARLQCWDSSRESLIRTSHRLITAFPADYETDVYDITVIIKLFITKNASLPCGNIMKR